MYKKKYLKYKKKYLDLKIQSGGERDAGAERDEHADVKDAFLGNTIRSTEPLAKMRYNNMISNLDGKEIIRSCANNKQLCTQINWIQLLNERKINLPDLDLPIPKMCLMMADDRQKEACTKFYHYTKGGKIVIWGNNYGQIDDSPTDAGYIAIACGWSHSVALKFTLD